MAKRTVYRTMRSFRRAHRGLAEIVGTLMLVVIVVAAATAFSFFVASYERTVLAEENSAHLTALEKIRVTGVRTLKGPQNFFVGLPIGNLTYGGALNLTIVSGDINPMAITGYLVDGAVAQVWNFTAGGGRTYTCTVGDAFTVQNYSNCTGLKQYGNALVTLPFVYKQGSPIQVDVITARGNDFTYTFFPPVVIPTVYYVQDGTSSIPVLDGLGSYQPAEADNASLLSYTWTLVSSGGAANSTITYSGPEVAASTLPAITSATSCSVVTNQCSFNGTLTVENTDGLSTIADFDLTQAASPVTFEETGLTTDTAWNVSITGGLTYHFVSTSSPSSSGTPFDLPNGVYYYTAFAATYTNQSGPLVVDGSAVSESVIF